MNLLIGTNEKHMRSILILIATVNVYYLIKCQVCRKQYVGSTITPCRKRFNQYKSNIILYSEGRWITFLYIIAFYVQFIIDQLLYIIV